MFLLLKNGKIDKDNDAILIAKGKIVRIGRGEQIEKVVGGEVRRVDLKGNRVIPGLIDSHTHLIPYGLEKNRPDLSKARSAKEVVEILKGYERKLEGVIIGHGFDDSSWPDRLTRELLDQAFPDRPVLARRICGHLTVANLKALELIRGYHRYIDHDQGILLERPSLELERIFPPPEDEMMEAIGRGGEELLRLGITTIHDIVTGDYLHGYQRFKGVRPRVRAYLLKGWGRSLSRLGLSSGFGDDHLKVMGIKLFLDGSVGARTAAMSSPYRDRRGKGRLLMGRRELNHWLKVAEAGSLQLMIHAIGDRAIRMVAELPIPSGNPNRHRIEHAEVLTDELIFQIKKKGLLLSLQPNFTHFWGRPGGLYDRALGRFRLGLMNRLGSIMRMGIRFGIGTDLLPPDPKYVIKGAGEHIKKGERLSPDTLIRYYTEGGSYLAFDEDRLGRLKEGYLADITVLDEDNKALLTILAGEIVHNSLEP